MTTQHPNLSLMERLSTVFPHDLARVGDLLDGNFVWHYFNPELPDLQGDYVGLAGVKTFFSQLADLTDNTFTVEDKQAFPVGDELVVTVASPSMTINGQSLETDAVVVWRVVGDRLVEAWDIPAIYAIRPQPQR